MQEGRVQLQNGGRRAPGHVVSKDRPLPPRFSGDIIRYFRPAAAAAAFAATEHPDFRRLIR